MLPARGLQAELSFQRANLPPTPLSADQFSRSAAATGRTDEPTPRAVLFDQAEAVLDDLAEFEKRLLAVIQGEVECDTPDWAEGPYRGGVYAPVLDDGVKVNIMPLQEGEVLRYRKVV